MKQIQWQYALIFTCSSCSSSSRALAFSSLMPKTIVFRSRSSNHQATIRLAAAAASSSSSLSQVTTTSTTPSFSFEDFVTFLEEKQTAIIHDLEELEEGAATFSNDPWGAYCNENASLHDTDDSSTRSGGRTRVMQGGNVVEKGACSLTVIRNGTLTAERAAAISGRQTTTSSNATVAAGSSYFAAALSMVLHSKSPMVPTFRSDVRVFCVATPDNGEVAWFGGGADLTPYYLMEDDVRFFHNIYKHLCDYYSNNTTKGENDNRYDYANMKKACDDYFYLPARQEHRGTGGIFYDDLTATPDSLAFTKQVVASWMPSWIPIVQKRRQMNYTSDEKYWQMLRRGRYLEFNLLYDRGVKFGLMTANPRVEGVMVSAPPQIAFEYNHVVAAGSREETLMQVLKSPREWV